MPRVCINVTGRNSQPYRFSLDRKIVRMGRAADNDIIIDCPSVSSHHCEMRRVGGGYILQDLDSTNGIKVDGTRMEVIDLENDMEINVGDADMEFELKEDERQTLGEEDHAPHGKPKLPPGPKEFDDSDEIPSRSVEEDELDDEDLDDADEGPKKKRKSEKARKPRPAPRPVATHSTPPSGATSFFITLIFLALSVAAFFFGMSLKHRAETKEEYPPNGRSLWNDLFNKSATVEQEQPAEPAAEDAPADAE